VEICPPAKKDQNTKQHHAHSTKRRLVAQKKKKPKEAAGPSLAARLSLNPQSAVQAIRKITKKPSSRYFLLLSIGGPQPPESAHHTWFGFSKGL